MKKTLNVNIGSMAFVLDEDAYYALNGYYEDIRSRLYDADSKEIMDDIESRTADIFRENLSFPSQVVTLDLVKKAIAMIGPAQTFGDRQYDPEPEDNTFPPKRKLYRSRYDNVIGGVCGGVAEYFGMDPSIVRILTFILVFFGGISLWIYIIAWIILPLSPKNPNDTTKKRRNRS